MELIDFEFNSAVVNQQGQIIARPAHLAQQFAEDLGGGITLEMVALPGGMFKMGSPAWTGDADEHPQHIVSLPPFFSGKYPVTQAQWEKVMRKALPCRFQGSRRPVENVSWDEAQEFCRRLSKISGRSYSMPGESQWEYACRAGSFQAFACGETITTDLANFVGEHTFLTEPKGVYRHGTTDVGSFPPNAFGLYDLHGNVWEWCADAWHADYQGAPLDGSTWDEQSGKPARVLRGGSWHEPPANCRSAARLHLNADYKDDFIGFRVALQSVEK